VVQVVEHLLCKHEDLSSNPSPIYLFIKNKQTKKTERVKRYVLKQENICNTATHTHTHTPGIYSYNILRNCKNWAGGFVQVVETPVSTQPNKNKKRNCKNQY
jgi:hypothetical protein